MPDNVTMGISWSMLQQKSDGWTKGLDQGMLQMKVDAFLGSALLDVLQVWDH